MIYQWFMAMAFRTGFRIPHQCIRQAVWGGFASFPGGSAGSRTRAAFSTVFVTSICFRFCPYRSPMEASSTRVRLGQVFRVKAGMTVDSVRLYKWVNGSQVRPTNLHEGLFLSGSHTLNTSHTPPSSFSVTADHFVLLTIALA